MKVIQVSTFFYPSVGGVERQAEEISLHLQARGIEVEVFATDASHGAEKRMSRQSESFHGVKVRRFWYLFGFGYFFRFSPGLVWALFRGDYDIIHIHNVHDAHIIPAALIRLVRKKKLVLTGHNPFVVGVEKRGKGLHILVGLYERAVRLFTGAIDMYVALLQSESETVRLRLGLDASRVTVIPNGIQDIFYSEEGDPRRFWNEWKIQPQEWKLVVGSVGRLNYVKGLQNLETAAEKLPEVLFVFVGGDDSYYPTLRRIFKRFNNVMLIGQYIPSNEVRDFYQAIDLFLLPSVYEPFGMTVVEAMAQGRPVMVTSVGGPKEFVEDTYADVVDPLDQEAWFERIAYYADHKAELAERGRKAREGAEQYRWEVVISKLEKMYRELGAKS